LACAGESSIRLWDIRYSQNNHEPLHLFNHANVRGLGFCPSQRHTLATGGRDGVTVWNSLSGHPRSCISIPNTTVNALLWSPFGKQILACHDHKLSKWSIVPGDSSLLEQEWGLPIENFNPDPPRIKEYKVVSLDYLRNGRVVSLDARGWLLHTSVFRDPLSLWEQKCSEMKRAPEFSVVR
jgi:WD40 repeat protein